MPNEKLAKRPPIVTIMGHVDHGKTSLLDALAKTALAQKEEGGITQSISAHALIYKGRKITFVDTPGHEAFLSMRRRGGKMADIVLLVVAATEGVKPQTQEALAHIRETKPYVVAVITKTDLPESNPEKVKRQLAENGLQLEGWGGEVPVVETSIKNEESLKKLLDLILLITDVSDFAGSQSGPLEGFVVESLLDRHKGPLSLVLLRSGKLNLGDIIYVGQTSGKIKNLTDDRGQILNSFGAGEAAWVMGLKEAAVPGEPVSLVLADAGMAKKADEDSTSVSKIPAAKTVLKIILKADSLGSLEALRESIGRLGSLESRLEIVRAAVGDINDSDIYLARDTQSLAVGFRVRILGSARDLADQYELEVRTYEVIYKLLEELQLGLSGLLAWKKERAKPSALVLKIFELPSGDKVLGCKIKNGTFKISQNILVKRGEEELFRSSIKNLKIGKEKADKAAAPAECGLLLSADLSSADLREGDEIVVL
ncbi:MAG: GTP-binding protein [Patescibacteria group bacterium]|nr:GTP-binding protein [Patescibacteria group bacterium]